MNGKRSTRSHRVGPGGIACVCCRPASKAKSKRIASREARRAANAELARQTTEATATRGAASLDPFGERGAA